MFTTSNSSPFQTTTTTDPFKTDDSFLDDVVGSVPGGGIVKGILSFAGSLFAGSPPEKFAEHGKVFMGTWIPEIFNKYQSDVSSLLTELSKAHNYMILFYETHLRESSSPRSKKGNKIGLDYVRSFEPKFKQYIQNLETEYNITKEKVSITFPTNMYSKIRPFSGSHEGSYFKYTATKKVGSQITDALTGGVTKFGSPMLYALIAFFVWTQFLNKYKGKNKSNFLKF